MTRDNKINELFSVFLQFKRCMHRQVVMQTHSNISVTQAEILFTIGKGANRLRDIAQAQTITPSAVTQQLKLLEAAGLIESVPSSEDRREHLLSITKKGQELLRQHRHAMKTHVRRYIDRLTDQEIDDFIYIMKKMIQTESTKETN